MTETEDRVELLEIYKLHSELADRVSQRREGANRLYVSLITGLVVFLAALVRFGIGDTPQGLVLCAVGLLGAVISASWCVVIISHRQLNSAKFRVLHELEKHLAFQFFTLEWDPVSKGAKSNRYWKLTTVEIVLPGICFLLFLGLVGYSFCR